jgi:hypothetical protein
MKRRIVCDRTEPECNKCLKKGLVCPGLGIRYRFNDGIAARGKLKGKKYEVNRSPRIGNAKPLDSITWVENEDIKGSETSSKDTSFPVSEPDEPPAQAILDEEPIEGITRTHLLSDPGEITYFPAPSEGLHVISAKTRYLFNHFSNHVSPVMILIDGSSNGYRHHILPVAYSDPTIRGAVCVASAFHLSVRDPSLRISAEGGRAAIIQALRKKGDGEMLGLETWATIVLLFVGELITASDDILRMYSMLKSFVSARGGVREESALGVFLDQQTRLQVNTSRNRVSIMRLI